jgi:hypothetical protein
MPASYSFRPDLKLLHTVLSGAFTDEELLGHYRCVAREGLLGGGVNELVDGRAVTHMAVTTAGHWELFYFALAHAEALRGMKAAMLASPGPALEMFALWQSQAALLPHQVAVFKDVAAACAWLGISPADLAGGPPGS